MQKSDDHTPLCYFCYPLTQQQKLIYKSHINMIKNKLKSFSQIYPQTQNTPQNRELTYKQNKFKVALSSFSRNNSQCSHRRLYSIFKEYSEQIVENLAEGIAENMAQRSYQLQMIENQIKNLVSSIPGIASQMIGQKLAQKVLRERANFPCLQCKKESIEKQESSQAKFSIQNKEEFIKKEEQLQKDVINQQPFNFTSHSQNTPIFMPMNLFFHYQP